MNIIIAIKAINLFIFVLLIIFAAQIIEVCNFDANPIVFNYKTNKKPEL